LAVKLTDRDSPDFMALSAVPVVQRQFSRVLSEAAHISSGTIDFCWLLGIFLGTVFGIALPANLSGNLSLATTAVETALLGRVASVVVVLIISVRIILARGMRDTTLVAADDGHHVMFRHMVASAWAAGLALFNFLFAATLGYALGLLLGAPGLALEMLDELSDTYSFSSLMHVTLRVLVEAAAVSWIAFFDMVVLSAVRESLSRSITRRLLMLVTAVLVIEALDAYLDWVVY
jgi:hypothetical protein